MSSEMSQTDKKDNKIYKSLYKVKDRYLPNADLEFLESNDDDLLRESFMQMLKKVACPEKKKDDQKKI